MFQLGNISFVESQHSKTTHSMYVISLMKRVTLNANPQHPKKTSYGSTSVTRFILPGRASAIVDVALK